MSSVIGYARVSTKDQDPGLQLDALKRAGAQRVFTDRAESSRRMDRPEWVACLDYLREGDTLLVWRLDRLAGTETHMIQLVNDLGAKGVDLRSLTEPEIDTTTPMGKALFGIVAVFAQLRVDTIRENTRAGLAHARANGRVGGRPTVMTPARVRQAQQMRTEGQSLAAIARVLGVGRSSVERSLGKATPAKKGPGQLQPTR